jgi:hypothetical protein
MVKTGQLPLSRNSTKVFISWVMRKYVRAK